MVIVASEDLYFRSIPYNEMKWLWSLLLRGWEPLCVLMHCFVKLLVMVFWFVWNVAKRCCCVSKCVVSLCVWEHFFKKIISSKSFEMQWRCIRMCLPNLGCVSRWSQQLHVFRIQKWEKEKNCFLPWTLQVWAQALKEKKCPPRQQTWVPAILQALCGIFSLQKTFMSAV